MTNPSMQKRHLVALILLLIFLTRLPLFSQGHVYLVLGSDTSIWDGLNVNRFNCFYRPYLYSDPTQNTNKVMNATFRGRFLDSEGQPLRLTWWMHGGNVFRHATNNDVPCNNAMALHLMKRYHGRAAAELGDELTLHYHTWDWTDENGDGIFYWNQARNFSQCREDFDITLCHYLLEEETFPVSFRSGWHYMDDNWQARLDEVLPFSMHNDFPAKRNDTVEPTDNIYDWSQAPAQWIPFHPSPENYQKPGKGRGWNLRSLYMGSMSAKTMNDLFKMAGTGVDQVACLWSHLPEANFPEQIANIHTLAQGASAAHPAVKFHYLTAIEAMQAWLKTMDRQKPSLTIEEIQNGNALYFSIQTDEPIFQRQPFVAVKDVYERHRILACRQVGENRWQTEQPEKRDELAKVGIALTDTVGNQTIRILRYRPDDLYLDDLDPAFQELTANFTSSSQYAWGTGSRAAALANGDTAAVRWDLNVTTAALYHLHLQLAPAASPAVDSLDLTIIQNSLPILQKKLKGPFAEKEWIYLTTVELGPGKSSYLCINSCNRSASTRHFAPDVIRVTPLVVARRMMIEPAALSFGRVSASDTAVISLSCINLGASTLTVGKMGMHNSLFTIGQDWPLIVPPFSRVSIPIRLFCERTGIIRDVLSIESDDPIEPVRLIAVTAQIDNYFAIIDNDDAGAYQETGPWATSVVQAEGPSSRYAPLNKIGAMAQFETRLKKAGLYEISEIVPTTVNSSDHALYKIWADRVLVDSVFLDQNEGSGGWKLIGRYMLPADQPVKVQVVNAGGHTRGDVIRADAIQLALLFESPVSVQATGDLTMTGTHLMGNYPNPFNQSTAIAFRIGSREPVVIDVYDLQGRWVRRLVDERMESGDHRINWDGRDALGRPVASGLYFYTLRSPSVFQTQRMFLIR